MFCFKMGLDECLQWSVIVIHIGELYRTAHRQMQTLTPFVVSWPTDGVSLQETVDFLISHFSSLRVLWFEAKKKRSIWEESY